MVHTRGIPYMRHTSPCESEYVHPEFAFCSGLAQVAQQGSDDNPKGMSFVGADHFVYSS